MLALLLGSLPAFDAGGLTLSIDEIQGAGHISPHLGAWVQTEAVVTAVDSNGFYLDGGDADADARTSSGLFVFTAGAPSVGIGDRVLVSGRVSEFVPGGTQTQNLSTTELIAPVIEAVLSIGGALPAPILVGAGGRPPPTEIIDDDAFTQFDPVTDGIDFFEALEGMRVLLQAPHAVGPTGRFREVFLVAEAGSSGANSRGGLTLRANDANPERIQLQLDAGLLPGAQADLDVGDTLGPVVGVVTYSFGSYELRPIEPFQVTPQALPRESTGLVGDATHLTLASYNVENLNPAALDRMSAIGADIVFGLGAPDLIALQEIQDNDGPANTGTVDASQTYQALVDAILAASGPGYAFFDIPPQDGQDGGQPGGNIRVGFLFNPLRVELVPGSVERIVDQDLSDGDAFSRSRKPLVAEFRFHGVRLVVVNNHFRSRQGSSPLFGALQPPTVGGLDRRIEQAAEVNAHVHGLLAGDPDLPVVVIGDLNELPFAEPLRVLTGGQAPILFDAGQFLPDVERYSFVFDGNAQQLDHLLASAALAGRVELDFVHRNAEFQEAPSDHDPLVARLDLQGLPEPDASAQLVAALLTVVFTARWRGRVRVRHRSSGHSAPRPMARWASSRSARVKRKRLSASPESA